MAVYRKRRLAGN